MRRKSKPKKKVRTIKKTSKKRQIHIVLTLPSKSTLLFFFIGLICIVSFTLYKIHKRNYLSFSSLPVSEKVVADVPLPAKIEIQSVNISIPVKETFIRNGIWEINENGASYLSTSAVPGMSGNIILYGHNTRSIFGPLTGVKIGDEIAVTSADGTVHEYKVKETFIVNPDQIQVLQPTRTETLTLYTCTGLFDSKRYVVQAEPI